MKCKKIFNEVMRKIVARKALEMPVDRVIFGYESWKYTYDDICVAVTEYERLIAEAEKRELENDRNRTADSTTPPA